MDLKKFTILGGDMRNIELAYQLQEDGHEVEIFGFDSLQLLLKQPIKLHEAITQSDVVIGPLPFTDDNVLLNAPFYTKEIIIDEVLNLLSAKQIFTAGKIPIKIQEKAKLLDLKTIDYFNREEMQALNAIPTAEGAIQLAMEEMRTTIHGSNALVLGYGRIGKSLSRMLYGIGANLFVEARSYSDLAWIKNFGYKPVHIKELEHYLPKMDVVFNTVPHIVLDEALLSKLNKKALIIELASKPGGVDLESCKEQAIKLISAQGLPGKVAPISAARVIKETVYNIMEEVRNGNGF